MTLPQQLRALVAISALIPCTPSPAKAADNSTQQSAEATIVMVRSYADGSQDAGGGFIYRVDRDVVYLVTAAHLVRPGATIQAQFFPSTTVWYDATRTPWLDLALDIAVIEVRYEPAVRYAHSLRRQFGFAGRSAPRDPSPADRARVIGQPEQRRSISDREHICDIDKSHLELCWKQSSADGYSGGGLFDDQWHLLGIALGVGNNGTTNGPTMRAVRIGTVLRRLDQLVPPQRLMSPRMQLISCLATIAPATWTIVEWQHFNDHLMRYRAAFLSQDADAEHTTLGSIVTRNQIGFWTTIGAGSVCVSPWLAPLVRRLRKGLFTANPDDSSGQAAFGLLSDSRIRRVGFQFVWKF